MKKVLSIAIIPMIMLLFYNQVANWHYHMLPNGIVIEHAHPFPKSNTSNTPFQNHTHTDFDLLILGLLSSTIGLVVLFFISQLVALPFPQKIFTLQANRHSLLYFTRTNPLRGPPSF